MSRHCTGTTASWCPVHGDCTCPVHLGTNEGQADRHLDDPSCPLHAPDSTHADLMAALRASIAKAKAARCPAVEP